jgi:RNA polymerase sigma-70 factor, ECF subfamily
LVTRLVKRPPSGVLEHEEMARRLECVLDQLSEFDREILFLRGMEGISNDQAAARLGVSPAAARKRFTRALLRARQALDQFGEGLGLVRDKE